MSKLKVLHVYLTYSPQTVGGVERVLDTLWSSLGAEVEHRMITTSAGPSHWAERYGCEVYAYKRLFTAASCPVSLSMLWHARRHIDWADVVHYHFPYPWGDLLAFMPGASAKPSLVTYHSDIVKQNFIKRLYAPLMNAFLRRMRWVIATSPNYAATSPVLRRHFDKVKVIPIGLREEDYPKPDTAEIAKLKKKVGEGFFLFVGVLRYYKGLTTLLEAVRETTLPVVIAGDGPMMPQLQAYKEEHGLDHVRLLGRVSEEEKMSLLQLCRAVVVPANARSEAFCIALAEGLMVGKALISTEVGSGTSYVNQDGETGVVVAPSDPGALRGAMQKFVEDPKCVEAYGRSASQRFQSQFCAEKMAQSYLDLYLDLYREIISV